MQYASATRGIQKLVLVAATMLAGCGGGGGGGGGSDPATGNPAKPAPLAIKNVIVVGTRYADIGAYGGRPGLVDLGNPARFPRFSELVAEAFGVSGQCNFFTIGRFSISERSECTNFAAADSYLTTGARLAIPDQLAKAGQAQGGSYTAQDLVLMEGGSEDLQAVLQFAMYSDDKLRSFTSPVLDRQTLDALLAQPRGWDLVAGLYMERLGDLYYENVKSQLLDKGATHVVLLDLQDYSRTPAVELAMGALSPGRDVGTFESVQASVRGWIDRFNARVRERVGSDARIVLVPFHDDFVNVVTHPTDYGLTNVTGQASWQGGLGTSDVARLDASPPPGLSAGWWQTWLFASGTELTPKGHQLLADSVNRALVRAGWR